MTTKQKLHQHLTELERGEAFSHDRMKDMAELIDKLAAPTLPVVRIEDGFSPNRHDYDQRYIVRENDQWYFDMLFDEDDDGSWFVNAADDKIHFDTYMATHVVNQDLIIELINASIQEES